mmetsp:Transcript_153681/g.267822  ORF Transcript_153681/g.267822 Transcript_153681/m.267822 type:complete len:202 (-) Transcript_153681:152-757(-)
MEVDELSHACGVAMQAAFNVAKIHKKHLQHIRGNHAQMTTCLVVMLSIGIEDIIGEHNRLTDVRSIMDSKPPSTVLHRERPIFRPELHQTCICSDDVCHLGNQRPEPRPVKFVRIIVPFSVAPAGPHPCCACLGIQTRKQVEKTQCGPGAAQYQVKPCFVALSTRCHLHQHVLVQGGDALQALFLARLVVPKEQETLCSHP